MSKDYVSLAEAATFGREFRRLFTFSQGLRETIPNAPEAEDIRRLVPEFLTAEREVLDLVEEVEAAGDYGFAAYDTVYAPIPSPQSETEEFISQTWHEVGPEALMDKIERVAETRSDCLAHHRLTTSDGQDHGWDRLGDALTKGAGLLSRSARPLYSGLVEAGRRNLIEIPDVPVLQVLKMRDTVNAMGGNATTGFHQGRASFTDAPEPERAQQRWTGTPGIKNLRPPISSRPR